MYIYLYADIIFLIRKFKYPFCDTIKKLLSIVLSKAENNCISKSIILIRLSSSSIQNSRKFFMTLHLLLVTF